MSKRRIFKNCKGITLIETLVAVAIFAIASAMVASFSIYAYRSRSRTQNEALATDRIMQGMQRMLEEVREMKEGENGAFSLVTADRNELVFYADVTDDGMADKVDYFLEDEELVREVISPVAGEQTQYPEEEAESLVVGKKIANSYDEPIFAYWGKDEEGVLVDLGYDFNVSEVRLIEVNLITETENGSKRRVLSSRVYPRNN